jgi:WD40 repeat protein
MAAFEGVRDMEPRAPPSQDSTDTERLDRQTFEVSEVEFFSPSTPYHPHGLPPRVAAITKNGRVGVWCTSSGRGLAALGGSGGVAHATHVAAWQPRDPDQRPLLAASFDDARVRIWDGVDFTVLHDKEADGVRCLVWYGAVAEGPPRLVSGSASGNVLMWCPRSGRVVNELKALGAEVSNPRHRCRGLLLCQAWK